MDHLGSIFEYEVYVEKYKVNYLKKKLKLTRYLDPIKYPKQYRLFKDKK